MSAYAHAHAHPRWLPLLWLLVVAVQLDFLVLSMLPVDKVYHPTLLFDEWLFGGTAPTVWLQSRLLHASAPNVWDYPITAVYFTHFLIWPIAAIVMFVSYRGAFLRFMRCFLPLTLLGYTTYLLMPVAPPWLASRWGDLPETTRVVVGILQYHHLESLVGLFPSSEITAATVGAVPSLHAAYPVLFALLLYRHGRRRLAALCSIYALVMGFVLVYAGEHYVGDLLLGWTYATAAVLLLDRPWGLVPRVRKLVTRRQPQ